MYKEKFNLDGKLAMITGGGGAIGLETARALAEAGATVVLGDFTDALIENGVSALKADGYDATTGIVFDVANPDAVEAAAAAVEKQHGKAADILICSAGIARSETPAEEVTDEHWRQVIDINLNGLFWCCRAFGKRMLDSGGGSIVNIGSMSGFIVNKPQPQSYYNASKAGVHHLTKSLAAEWATRGVRVNAVAPTYIDTPLNRFVESKPEMFNAWIDNTPMKRLGRCDEIASVALFLASDAASLLTGSIILADGGYTCW
ncbi:MAG: SDR family NAD(P)-dependent oxidoreductase [Gammaproteobacteria bacterium WSBS_2016_MAG_OTU1]